MGRISELKIIKEVTPKEMFCIKGTSCLFGGCPAIFETNNNSYIIIGKKVNGKSLGISKRISKDEILIEVQKSLIDKKQ